MKRSFIFVVFSAAAFFITVSAHAASTIDLDADRISFAETSGVAIAEGNVKISNGDAKLYAPYAEYDSENGMIRAQASPGNKITFVARGGQLSGESLEYNTITGVGRFSDPAGKIGVFRMKGQDLEVMPARDSAAAKRVRRPISDDTIVGSWREATITTCSRTMPHYRLEAKSITFIENESVIISKPSLYLGERKLFTYPFDYYVSLRPSSKRNNHSIFPKFGYDSKKGAGIGATMGYGWGSGFAELEVIGWTKGIWEGRGRIYQDLWKDAHLIIETRRQYNKDTRETLWRPKVGLRAEFSGVELGVDWSQREQIDVEKRIGSTTTYTVWKEPEVQLMSKWYDDPAAGGKFRLLASWGRYEDATDGFSQGIVERTGFGLQLKNDEISKKEGFEPYYNAVYWHYNYGGRGNGTQQILHATVGVKWKAGVFDLESAYAQRWTWGESPMGFDSYQDARIAYQAVYMPIKTRDPEIKWKVGVRAGYDIDEKRLAEMVYKVEYDQHCLLWEAIYRNDRVGSDNWFGLNITVKGTNGGRGHIAGSELIEPIDVPEYLVPLSKEKKYMSN